MSTTITPNTLRSIMLVTVLVILVLFTLFQLRFYLGGPSITIQQKYYEVTDPYVDMVFMVANTKDLRVQGVPVIPQVSGRVEKRVFVQEGLNAITIEAIDPYSARNIQKIYVFYPQVPK